MTDLDDLTKIIYKPAGYFIAPEGEERIGDVSNVVFSNGWILDDDGRCLFIMLHQIQECMLPFQLLTVA